MQNWQFYFIVGLLACIMTNLSYKDKKNGWTCYWIILSIAYFIAAIVSQLRQ